jgi:drug/metabolite transporter (DMT)-like permease
VIVQLSFERLPPQPHLLKGLAWLGLAILSWGALFSVAKRTLPVLDAFFLGSLRYALGVLLFIAILWIAEGRQALRYGGRFLPAAVFGAIGFCCFNILVWWGLYFTRPEHASIIMALQTPMTALAVWLTRGLRPAPFTLGCIGAAIGGVLLVVTRGDPAQVLAGGSLRGDLLVFLGAVSWVIYTMAGSVFSGWSPLRMTVLTCIPGTVALVAVNAFTIAAGYSQLPTLAQVLSVKWQIAYFVIFTVVLGVLGFNNGVKHLGALNTMLMLNLIPVIVFAIEAGLGRSFEAIEIGGAAVVLGALAANNLYLRRMAARA